MRQFFLALLCISFSYAQTTKDPLSTADWKAQEQWADSIYTQLSLEEKIGQLFMVMAFSEQGEAHYKKIKKQVIENHVGGIIFSLGDPVGQTQWLNKLQKEAKTPLLIGMDAEWGVAMRLDSVRPFPWNMTLGAIQDNRLVEEVGFRIGEQAKRLGVHINFAPDVDINTNPKNPIIGNRSFGEDKENVALKGIAFMHGTHRAGVLSSAKHFPGHGDSSKDSHLDLPLIDFDKARLISTEVYPFERLSQAGVSSIMVAHLNVPAFEKGVPSSLSKKIVQDLLIDRMQFKGLIITDALNMGGAAEVSKINSIDVAAFLAGNDILLIPNDVKKAIKKMKRAFNQGKFTEERLAHSVKKILRAKYKVGLNNFKPIETKNLVAELNTVKDDYLIERSTAEAITLIKGGNSLPLPTDETLGFLSLGEADGTTFFKELEKELVLKVLPFSGDTATTVKAAKDVSTIVVGFHRSNESPWKASDFSKDELRLLNSLNREHQLVLVPFVKPYALSKLSSLEDFSIVLMAYQNTLEAQRTAAKMLLGKQEIIGKLPVSVNASYPVGHGEILTHNDLPLEDHTAFAAGMDINKLIELDNLAQLVLDSLMAPGFQVLAARHGKVFYHKAFGHHTYAKEKTVKLTDIYDLASLTKMLVTLPIVIQEVDQRKFNFDTTLGALSPRFKSTNKANLSLKEILSHQSGIVPWVPFYKETLREKDGKLLRKYYRNRLTRKNSLEVAENVFARPKVADEQYKALINSDLWDKGYHYSDLPFIFMQHILEETYDKPLNQLFLERIAIPLGLESTVFSPLKSIAKERIVPSEIDTYFRQQTLQGYVHDMTAALQGGVSGHAGLFSSAKEVATIMQLFLQKGYYNGQKLFSATTFDQFNQCYYCSEGNRRGVGLDKPQAGGGGMTFQGISSESFGHAGFTGTYAWADPSTGIVFVFLSNRTYPSMENRKLIDHSIRPRMLKLVYDAIVY
ncbi:MAG: serine hydrolase [Flavobacteriaceae bacterium]|nr:serine hydrolase [Flavobacteriaceae bacterium]